MQRNRMIRWMSALIGAAVLSVARIASGDVITTDTYIDSYAGTPAPFIPSNQDFNYGGSAATTVVTSPGSTQYRFLLTIDPSSAGLGPIDHASGLDVTSCPTTARFAHGALAINDQATPSGNEEFKVYAWADIAAKGSLALKHAAPTTKP